MQTVFQPGIGFSKSYNLVTATGGLTGTFSTLSTQNLPAFLSASLAYGPTNVTLNLQSSLGMSGLGTNQRAVGQALDSAFNGGSGLNAMPGLYSLTADQIGYALTVLSGSNASVGQSNAVIAGGQFTTLLANRAVTRRAQPQTATLAATAELAGCEAAAEACQAADPNWSAWGSAFGGAQWLNTEPGTAAPGGAAVDRRRRVRRRLSRRAADGAGRGAGLQRQQLFGGGDRRQRPRHRLPCRPLRHARLEQLLRQRCAGLQPLRRQHHAPDRGHRHDRDGEVAGDRQPVRRAPRGRPAVRVQRPAGTRLAVTPFAAFQPVFLWTPAVSESSVTATGQPGVFALNYQAQNTTSLPTFLGAQFDASTSSAAGRSAPGCARPGCTSSTPIAA